MKNRVTMKATRFAAVLGAIFLALCLSMQVHAEDLGEGYTIGNSTMNLLIGGLITENGTPAEELIEGEIYGGLNVFADHMYYITADQRSVVRVDRNDGTLETLVTGSEITRLFVVNDEVIYYIDADQAYCLGDDETEPAEEAIEEPAEEALEESGEEPTGEPAALTDGADVLSMIPTAYGMLYVRGQVLSYDLYAADSLFAAGVYQYYTQDGYLIYTVEGVQYQIALTELFGVEGDGVDEYEAAAASEEYDLGEMFTMEEILLNASAEPETEYCPVCAQQAEEITEEDFHTIEEEPLGENLMVGELSACNAGLSSMQQNVVARAEQLANITWTAKSNVTGWYAQSSNQYRAGTTYKGIPYGQPYGTSGTSGVYVGYDSVYKSTLDDSTIEEFANAADTAGSVFYTTTITNPDGIKMPYYSTDCSAFASYCWGINRNTTRTLPVFAVQQPSSIAAMQVGDILDCPGSHVILIEDVIYDSYGNVKSVVTIEETPPLTTRRTWTGTSGYYALNSLYSKYLNAGYNLYRKTNMETGVTNTAPHVSYMTHVQTYGWLNEVRDGAVSGTTGEGKRMEAIRITLKNVSGSISYQTHVQTYGWQDWMTTSAGTSTGSAAMAGTSGESKRLEAICIRLSGNAASEYDIYYRVHAQTYGWLDWAKNGNPAGTAGLSKRLEAVQIELVPKGGSAPGATGRPYVEAETAEKIPMSISYQTHVQTYGWLTPVGDGALSGTTGEAKRMEAIRIGLTGTEVTGGISCSTHVQTYGWLDPVSITAGTSVENASMSGTSGESKRMEAVRISLTGQLAQKYDIYYRVHAQTYGWLDWAKNGESAGTAGLSKRLECIEIRLVPKGSRAPGSTQKPFIQG